jgi:serine O-acetyltransferase
MLGQSHIQLYRLAHRLHQRGVPRLPDLLNGLNRRLNGIEIHPAAEIGDNLIIVHPVGIVIGGHCRIGRNVMINQGVSLGYRRGPVPGDGHPTVEDGVVIGAGAKVLGPIRIGTGAVVGANAVVLQSVPPFATAVGIPAKILPRARPDDAPDWVDLLLAASPDPAGAAPAGRPRE